MNPAIGALATGEVPIQLGTFGIQHDLAAIRALRLLGFGGCHEAAHGPCRTVIKR